MTYQSFFSLEICVILWIINTWSRSKRTCSYSVLKGVAQLALRLIIFKWLLTYTESLIAYRNLLNPMCGNITIPLGSINLVESISWLQHEICGIAVNDLNVIYWYMRVVKIWSRKGVWKNTYLVTNTVRITDTKTQPRNHYCQQHFHF